jgi:hypothetical protein
MAVVLSAGWLHATVIDPTVKFTTGGVGSTHITCSTQGCITPLSPVIDANGVANLDIFNESGRNITSLFFTIPTVNFNQDFNASTNAFTNAAILPDEDHNQLLVLFSGVGNAAQGGSDFLGADPTHPGDGLIGFFRGGTVSAQAFFGTVPPGSTFQGFLDGQHATLDLSTVPEPGMFWVSFIGLAGVLVAKRRLSNT